jgi:hypothetical protein
VATGPTIDVLVDWRKAGFATIANPIFATATTGWSVGASINAAATSLTRSTGDGPAVVPGGSAARTYATLVTTGTNGSGCNYDFGTTSFTSGRTYRFRVWIKSVSGTTSAKILVGSLGTPGDRASATMTITTSWVAYEVNWTPSGTRTDVEVNVTNNAASIMTARISVGEVFETLDDIEADVTGLSYGRGSAFDGASESPGFAALRVKNSSLKYNPDNASSTIFGLLKLGRPVLIRATWSNLLYPLFYGTLTRIVLYPESRTAELHFADPLHEYDRFEANLATSQSRTLQEFRGEILDLMGVTSSQRSLTTGVESNRPTTWADAVSGLSVLESVNAGCATAHYIRPHPSTAVLYQYVTVDRMTLAASTSSESWDGVDITDASGFDFTDEAIANSQRVVAHPRQPVTLAEWGKVWDGVNILPYALPNGSSVTFWANCATPVMSPVTDEHSDPVVALTINDTAYGQNIKLEITNSSGTDTVLTGLDIFAYAIAADLDQTAVVEDSSSIATYGRRQPAPMDSEWLIDQGDAEGLAAWVVLRYKDPKARPLVTRQNEFPSVLTREVTETIALTIVRTSTSAKEHLIRSFRHDVVPGMSWGATYQLEEAPGTGTVWFQLDTAGAGIDDGAGGTEGHLGY